MNEEDDTSRFTIRGAEALPESAYISDAENLRIEKLNTRVTLVTVLIPCLLVIVLAVAYLDIKNRVINTQNTGSMGVQNLSKDLESRFSNLSLKQAKIELQLTENSKTLETAAAALQVNLKKASAEFKRITDGKPDQSALKAMSNKTEASFAALQKKMAALNASFVRLDDELAALNASFSSFDDELAAQILLMADGLKKDQGRLTRLEKTTQRLDSKKLSKESMNLALSLERLALKEMVKDRIREMEKKLAVLSKQMGTQNQQPEAQMRHVSPSSPTAPPPSSSVAPPPSPSSDAPFSYGNIVEQTIN